MQKMTMDQSVQTYLDAHDITSDARRAVTAPPMMFIDGAFTQGQSTDTLPVYEPSTGGLLNHVLLGTEADVDAAVNAARGAFEGSWASMLPNERQAILLRLADLVEKHAQTLAEIETIDNGKAICPCLDVDILGSADLLRYMAGWATKIEGTTRDISLPGDFFSYSLRDPIGVIGAIVPWNWPLSMAMWKCAAPLAAGCTIVLKTAELTPLSMTYFAGLCQEAGLPDGVLNIITGAGQDVGAYLAQHPGLDKVSFTGSTRVGRSIGQAAIANFNAVTLELGGKSPMVAFDDCDITELADSTRWSIFFNAGQNCSAGSRLYLHKSIYQQGLDAITAVADSLKVLPGLDPDCDVGPIISAPHRDRIMGCIEQGAREGDIICGGTAPEGPGYFINPTVIALQDNQSSLVQEEIFGPVLVVLPFEDEADAVSMANDNLYGLGASVWTANGSRAQRVSRALKSGSVWINCHDMVDSATPFGGVKGSGIGKDLGREQFESVLKSKTITMKY